MTVLSPEPIDSIMQATETPTNENTDSHQKTSEIAMRHLDEVISQVVNEAIEYADKPPEERTLPVITRKLPPPKPRPQQVQAVANLSHVTQPFAAAMKGAQNLQAAQMVSFNSVMQQNPHMVMQYNGQQYSTTGQISPAQLQQQYAQQLQFQQHQYQNPSAFAQMQQIQQLVISSSNAQQALAAVTAAGGTLVYATSAQQAAELNGQRVAAATAAANGQQQSTTLTAQQQQAVAMATQQQQQMYAAQQRWAAVGQQQASQQQQIYNEHQLAQALQLQQQAANQQHAQYLDRDQLARYISYQQQQGQPQ